MFLTKLKAAVAIGAALLIGLGVGLLAYRPAAADPIRPATEEKKHETAPAATDGDAPERKVASKPAEVERPVGTWERKAGTFRIVLHFEPDHVRATISGRTPERDNRVSPSFSGSSASADPASDAILVRNSGGRGDAINVTVDADYSVTRDHVLYGVITGVEADELEEEVKGGAGLLADYAFSVRYRVDGDVLTIKDFKFGLPDDNKNAQKETALFMGRYKKMDGRDRDTQGRRKSY
jgi:hypothetical protein